MGNITEKIIKSVVKIKKEYDSCHIAAYSAKGAYFIMLSAVPLMLIAVMLMGLMEPLDIFGINSIVTEQLSKNTFLQNFLREVSSHSTISAISVTSVFLLWSATKGVRSIAEGIGAIFPQQTKRRFVQQSIRAVLYTFLMLLAFGASLVLLVFVSPLEKLLQHFLGGETAFILGVINFRNIIFWVVLTVMFTLAYRLFGRTAFGFVHNLSGGAFAALGWVVYSYGFSVYIKHFSRYPVLYGSFGGIMLFMLWLYMCINILLCGALVNKLRCGKKCD